MRGSIHVWRALSGFRIERFLEGSTRTPGWTILWGHGVCAAPSVWHKRDPRHIPEQVFEQQMQTLLSQGYKFLSLSEGVDLLKKGKAMDRAVTLTFDDGFRNVLHFAYPVMRRLNLKGCIFVVAGLAGGSQLLWTDMIDVVCHWHKGRTLEVEMIRGKVRFDLQDDQAVGDAITELKREFRRLPDSERRRHLKQLECLFAEVDPAFVPDDFHLATFEELRQLDPTVMEIGSHTLTHPQLDRIEDRLVLEQEITGAKRELEFRVGRPVPHFCYPAGAYNERAVEEVKRAGHVCGLTVEYGINKPDKSPFELQRLGLSPEVAQFKCRLSGLEASLLRVKRKLESRGLARPSRPELSEVDVSIPGAEDYLQPVSKLPGESVPVLSGVGRRRMRLVVFSHKPTWISQASASGFATDGGFPFQMKAISELFDSTVLLVPCVPNPGLGEAPLVGHKITVVPLTNPTGTELFRKLAFPFWLLRNLPSILRELRRADAVHAPIPGDIGTVGMILALIFRKRLFVRHCGNWFKPETWAQQFWRWFMERFGGGRNVMLATGGGQEPPSARNGSIAWIFASSLTEKELEVFAHERAYPMSGGRPPRLILVARQEKAKGAGTVIQSLPLLAKRFSNLTFEIVGEGAAIPEFRQLAHELGVGDRVHFAGKLSHEQVMQRLQAASLFVFPTTSSEGFPKAVLEGLASGLPAVATGVSVLPHLLSSGCGMVLNEASPEAVARAIEYMFSDPARYAEMSRQAIQTARQYSLEAWQEAIRSHLEPAWGALNTGLQVNVKATRDLCNN
jgi:glycosyltransferase involved in cell wall biosynthesis/peptidoglycan/xylan/chitin deacetylase (PgdA/CDA1 family)